MVENNNPNVFLSYEQLNTGPHKIHKSKTEHKLAIFELSKGIADFLKEDNYTLFQKVCEDLEKMCKRFRR